MATHHIPEPPPVRDGPHPAICLVLGFGVVIGIAILVHFIFNRLV